MATNKPVVAWYFRGAEATNGTALAINVLSTLVLACLAKPSSNTVANYAPAFVITKGSPMSSYSATGSSSGANGFGLSAVSSGTILYDTVNGNRANYDHLIVTTSYSLPLGTSNPVNGYLTMYIPTVAQTDSGTYYCTYTTGDSSATAITFGTSGSFTLTVTTKSTQSACLSKPMDKLVQYSILLGASKLLL